MYRKYYQNTLNAFSPMIHMAAHSHHPWPDITRNATLEYHQDSVEKLDGKWDKIFNEIVPDSQKLIAKILNLPRPDDIAFASNTHELLYRLISSFYHQQKIRILTTDGEFHSAMRQFQRYREWDKIEIVLVDSTSEELENHLLDEVSKKEFDLIFLSHVFFQTGRVLRLELLQELLALKSENCVICLDAYHSFCAIPTDLSAYADEIYLLAGSYKYAQAGEGMCFMSLPKDCRLRPLNTGWFAGFNQLANSKAQVNFQSNGNRFAGSTRDFCAHYRFNAVWKMFFNDNIDVKAIHHHVMDLQQRFLSRNTRENNPIFSTPIRNSGSHFLAFDMKTAQVAQEAFEQLRELKVLTDYRGQFLRLGFGLYHDTQLIDKICELIKKLKFSR